ncbi:MAG: tRNA-dihydrouridine synthase family protein [Promethearchaeota archaeon]|nr:MAG: tRNA-dihydrouridine synthase family protein [Candidatus Lokiarchaeota archaeon]
MKLGTLKLENNLILAPMQNVTTGPYRRFCRNFHKIGLVCVPMIYTKGIVSSPKSFENEIVKIEKENPISVQLIGSDPDALKKSIEYLESFKFDVLDINAGCPSKRAIRAKQGGYLLDDFKKLKGLLEIAVKFSSRPVSLKTRTGFKKNYDLITFKEIINDSGLEFLTVHARTVKDGSNDSAIDLNFLKKIKESISIPLVGNGDIINPKIAKDFIDYTNVDAIMIGRGTLGNPEIFYQIHEYLTKGRKIPFINNKTLMREHVELYERLLDDFLDGTTHNYSLEEYKFIELKRNSIWLTKNIDNSTDLRRKISKTKNLKQLKLVLENILIN